MQDWVDLVIVKLAVALFLEAVVHLSMVVFVIVHSVAHDVVEQIVYVAMSAKVLISL